MVEVVVECFVEKIFSEAPEGIITINGRRRQERRQKVGDTD
jgi:hypothetical protein